MTKGHTDQFERVMVRIEGVAPLLMHSPDHMHPDDPLQREMKGLNAKRTNKTDADIRRIYELDFLQGLYCNEHGPYLPDTMLEGALVDGAKKRRLGLKMKSGAFVGDVVNPLLYDGPRDPAGLYANASFVDTRSVVVGGKRIFRTRPRFNSWACEFLLHVNTSVISLADVEKALRDAGLLCGVGDFRPKFGRFAVTAFMQENAGAV